jgi:hypothetical protein
VDSLEKLKGDSVAMLEYHAVDEFENDDAWGRINFYYIWGIPYAKFDGRDSVVGGWEVSEYLDAYNAMMALPSPCTLSILVDYNSTTRQLWVKATVFAVDSFSNAHLRYAIAESHIYYPWQWLDSLHHVTRKMLPDSLGVAFDINPGQSFVDSQTYVLDSAWNDTNCYVVVFVQRDDPGLVKPVFRSAKSELVREPSWVFGDANGDGMVDAADIVYLIDYLFVNASAPDPPASGDPNSDCKIDAADVIYLINFLFIAGPAPLEGCG